MIPVFVLASASATQSHIKSGWWTMMVAVQAAGGRPTEDDARVSNSNVMLGYWVVPCLSLSNLKRSFLGYHFS